MISNLIGSAGEHASGGVVIIGVNSRREMLHLRGSNRRPSDATAEMPELKSRFKRSGATSAGGCGPGSTIAGHVAEALMWPFGMIQTDDDHAVATVDMPSSSVAMTPGT